MLRVNYSSPVPIYEQLCSELRRMIRTGELKAGDSLPPIRSLAGQLDVAVNTVARAYQELEGAGLIEGNRRKGSFVRSQNVPLSGHEARIFKDPILRLVQQGMRREEIAAIFEDNLKQVFD